MASKLFNSNKISLRLLINNYFRCHSSLSSFSTLNVNKNKPNEEVIKIPKRIERFQSINDQFFRYLSNFSFLGQIRGPTDILRALAETTQRVSTQKVFTFKV